MIQFRILKDPCKMQATLHCSTSPLPNSKLILKSNIKVTIMTYMLVKRAGYKLEGRLPCTMSANSVSSTREGREGAGAGLGVVWKK